MIVRFDDPARDEWHDAVLAYEDQREGLGVEFVAAVREAARIIGDAPLRWPKYTRGTRAYRLDRFPYRIVYAVEHDEIAVITVMHTKRSDDYWLKRRRSTGES